MIGFEYYGLFLTQESKNRLAKWLFFNGYGFDNDIIKAKENWYLDHVTLLHSSIAKYHPQLEVRLEALTWMQAGNYITFEVNGIGESHNALAFRCNIMPYYCANKVPHITICTFNGGKPVDSNYITEWKNIEPIVVEAKLKKR